MLFHDQGFVCKKQSVLVSRTHAERAGNRVVAKPFANPFVEKGAPPAPAADDVEQAVAFVENVVEQLRGGQPVERDELAAPALEQPPEEGVRFRIE